MADDYDSPWKEAIERHFADFLAFYFPDAHAQIDWTSSPVFLEQELRSVTHDAPPDTRIIDKLVRVTRRSGEPSWVFVQNGTWSSICDSVPGPRQWWWTCFV